MRTLIISFILCILAPVVMADELLEYDRYQRPYLNMSRVKALVGEAAFQELRNERDSRIRACRKRYEPQIRKLRVPGYAYHLEVEDQMYQCINQVDIDLAMKAQSLRARGTSDKSTNTGTSRGEASGIQSLSSPEWFTCTVPPICVEYKIDDPKDQQDFVTRCANYQSGRQCPTEGRRCEQTAPGRKSVTHGGHVSNDEFRRACLANGGKFLCFGKFC